MKKTKNENDTWWRDFLSSLSDQAENATDPIDKITGYTRKALRSMGEGPLPLEKFARYKGASDDEAEVFGSMQELVGLAGIIDPSTKVKRAKTLIENAGGRILKEEGPIVTWINKAGKKLVNNLEERFGARDVGTNSRATGDSLRQINEAPRQLGNDVKSLAADASGMSTEELHRPGLYYRIGKSGEPTYLGKKVDPGASGGAIIEVRPGKAPSIYQGSGTPRDLDRFNKSATGQDIIDRVRSERGAVGANINSDLPPKPKPKHTIISSRQIPEIKLTPEDIKKFKPTI